MTEAQQSTHAHVWSPFEDLAESDVAAKSDELPHLAEVWREEKGQLGDDEALRTFNERLQREWAIETGIIERLYSLDRGVTRLLIERGIDASLIPSEATDRPPELVATIIRDQESAIDWLFDVVAEQRPLSVGFIKELHALMTRHQPTTSAVDQFGKEVEIPLKHGDFKDWPNNPTRPDGRLHEYCPPEQVSIEMDRLIELHVKHRAAEVPAEVEAAWLHHRFVQIHPFQDGNGRIARALASLVFIQEGWFPLVINRDDRARYLDALEEADENGLEPVVGLFSSCQRKAFVNALGIAREVTRESERLDQQLAAISEMFASRDAALRRELDHAKDLARTTWSSAVERLEEVAHQLEASMSSPGRNRHAFVDSASDHDERRTWHRWQILEAAHDLGYFAGLRDFASWARLCLDTESGRGEILLSLHGIGREYRGVIGASMIFYRRQESSEGERHAIDLQPVSDDLFQINYRDTEESVASRFDSWFERSLVKGLDAWRRSE